VKQLRYGGILHDIGKIGIAENILCKQSQLTDEMSVMREHPSIGASIVGPVSFLGTARRGEGHHEKWNGTGYPEGIRARPFPSSPGWWPAPTPGTPAPTRPYQRAMGTHAAMEVMNRLRGVSLDPAVVDALARVLEKGRCGRRRHTARCPLHREPAEDMGSGMSWDKLKRRRRPRPLPCTWT
jgi:HD-GYP domain-containing protein (c-di-GMP phosphodiesterase class II)